MKRRQPRRINCPGWNVWDTDPEYLPMAHYLGDIQLGDNGHTFAFLCMDVGRTFEHDDEFEPVPPGWPLPQFCPNCIRILKKGLARVPPSRPGDHRQRSAPSRFRGVLIGPRLGTGTDVRVRGLGGKDYRDYRLVPAPGRFMLETDDVPYHGRLVVSLASPVMFADGWERDVRDGKRLTVDCRILFRGDEWDSVMVIRWANEWELATSKGPHHFFIKFPDGPGNVPRIMGGAPR